MNTNNTILPPANGKKLWRVKRASNEDGDEASQTSMECLKSSLKISAAAAAAIKGKNLGRRPSLKRPKNVPGKPKNFVFVDLSPVKSEEFDNNNDTIVDVASSPVHQLPSPQESDGDSQVFDVGHSDDSCSISSVDSGSPTFSVTDSSFFSGSSPEILQNNSLGLGITGLEFNLPTDVTGQSSDVFPNHIVSQQLYGYQKAMIQQHYQIQLLQQQLQEQQRKQIQLQNQQLQQELARLAMLSQLQPQHVFNLASPKTVETNMKVSKRRSDKKKTTDQFKVYKGPTKRTRSVSEGSVNKKKNHERRSASVSVVSASVGFTDTPMATSDCMVGNIPTTTPDNIDPFLSLDTVLDTSFSFPSSTNYSDMVGNFDATGFANTLLEGCGSDPLLDIRQDNTDFQQLVSL